MSTTAESARAIYTGMVWELADLARSGWRYRNDTTETMSEDDTRSARRERTQELGRALAWPTYHTAIPYAHR